MVKKITSNHVLYAIIFFTHYGLKVRATDALDCNFDKGLCEWKQATGDKFNWTWTSNSTSTANTGPNADHTSGEGAYVYIDTSSNEVNKQDNARLRSPRTTPGTRGTYCFSFWYYMYGQHVGRLRVFKNNKWTKLFDKSGNTGKGWKFGQTEFTADTNFRIIIDGRVINSTNHDLGDIAIDDIMMFPGRCKGCGDPSPAFGFANSENFTIGSKVTVKCAVGYTLKGASSIDCLANRSWSDKPNCNLIDCGTRNITNGEFTAKSGITFGHIARQSCNKGYIITGPETVMCITSGWNDTAANCTIVESENKALIAVYFSVPIVVVALVTGLIIIMTRRGLIKCMARQYSKKKNAKTSHSQAGSSFSNRAYIGHNIESQTDKENRLPEDTDYAVITEEQDRKQQSESYVYYNTVDATKTQLENDDHAYNHTDNVTAPFFDMSYSHVSKNKDENNVKSNYNTTILPCRTNEGFQSDVQDENNKYDILDSNVTVQRSGTELEEDLDPEYDHAKAGGTDPEDLDDYSHLNGAVMKPIENDLKEVSGPEYEYAKEISEAEPNGTYPAQVRKGGYKPQNYDLEVDNRDSVEDDRHYFVLEKEDNENAKQSGSFESNVHDYFILEKMET